MIVIRSQVCSDNFNRPTENPIGGNWSKITWTSNENITRSMCINASYPNILTPILPGTNGVEWNGIYWNANTFNNNQYCEFKYVQASTWSADFMVCCRMIGTGSSGNCYGFYMWGAGTTARIRKYVNGTMNEIVTGVVGAPVLNSTYAIEANGTTIRALVNGIQVLSVVDSAITSGTVGIVGPNSLTGTPKGFDNFAAGNLISVTGPYPVFRPDLV